MIQHCVHNFVGKAKDQLVRLNASYEVRIEPDAFAIGSHRRLHWQRLIGRKFHAE